MNFLLFLSLLFLFQLFFALLSKRMARRQKDGEDYFLARRSVSFFPLMMTFFATQVGGGAILGVAEEAYRFGTIAFFYPLGIALGLIILGLGVGRRIASLQLNTVAQLFEELFGSPLFRKFASLLSMISLLMILVGQLIASSKFLVSLGLTSQWPFILFWLLVIYYTARGGLSAVIFTDALHALVFFFSLSFSLLFVNQAGELPSMQVEFGEASWVGWFLMPLAFMLIEQDVGQRCFAARSGRTVSSAALSAGLMTLLLCIVPLYFGMMAKSLNLDVPKGGSVLMSAVTALTNPWICAVVGYAVMAAIISTATSLINAISSNLAQDFPLFQTQDISLLRWITASIATFAIALSYGFGNVLTLLTQSCELSVSCMLVPILTALYTTRRGYLDGALPFLLGFLGFFLFRAWPPPIPRELATLLLSATGLALAPLLRREQPVRS